MKKGIAPCPGIDTDAQWGYSRTKGRIFEYKLHLTCTTGDLILPLTADVTTANIPGNKMYTPLTASSVFSLPSALYMVADPRYDDKKLYEYSKKTLGMDLVCPLQRYESTSKKRLELECFYQSALGHVIYNRRRISIEPSIEHIKSVFRIDPLPVRGFHKVPAIVLLSVLLYQIMVYYNFKTNKSNPKSIKYMIGTW
jgi:Transposase DDE domain